MPPAGAPLVLQTPAAVVSPSAVPPIEFVMDLCGEYWTQEIVPLDR